MLTRTLHWASPIALALATLTRSVPAGDVVHVPGDFPTIQAAIDDDATEAGDVVLVAPGTYRERIDLRGKAIAVRGSGGAAVTVIDAERLGSVVTCSTGETAATVVEGFTITGGSGTADDDGITHGGGFRIGGTSPTIVRCVIIGNTATRGGGVFVDASSDPRFTECTLTANTSHGAGVYTKDSQVTLDSCTFERNDGHELLAVRSVVTLSRCTFDDAGFDATNFAIESTVDVSDCDFLGAGVFGSEDGGAFGSRDGSLTLRRCTIESYHASAIIADGGTLTLTDCSFIENASFGRGGGVQAEGTELSIDRVTFQGNSADEGGAVWAWGSAVAIANSVFIDNAAVEDDRGGGAVFLGASETDVTDCVFFSNDADQSQGGALAFDAGIATVRACAFRWNVAGGGGAISSSATASILDCVFDSCAAGVGGAMLATSGAALTVTRCQFRQNAASNGGAVWSQDEGDAAYTNCQFIDNSAVRSGGAIYGKRYDLFISDSEFSGNQAGTDDFNGFGGAIYNGNCQPTVTNTTFRGNVATGPIGHGGAIMNVRSEGTVEGCLFADNVATTAGGVMEGGPTAPFLTIADSLVCGSAPADFSGGWIDGGGNDFREDCAPSCRGDLDDSGSVDLTDLLGLLFSWGPCRAACPADIDGNGDVDSVDVWILLAAWGAC